MSTKQLRALKQTDCLELCQEHADFNGGSFVRQKFEDGEAHVSDETPDQLIPEPRVSPAFPAQCSIMNTRALGDKHCLKKIARAMPVVRRMQ